LCWRSFYKSLRNCPNRCQRVSKTKGKKPAKFQAAVSICRFLCPRMLLYIATHYNTLQYIATHCNTLQHTATHCNTLQHTHASIYAWLSLAASLVCCTSWRPSDDPWDATAACCNTLQRTATQCYTLLDNVEKDLNRVFLNI